MADDASKDLKTYTLEELWRLFPIILRAHNPVYAAWYEEEKKNILQALHGYPVYRINHIGSTSVKGLLAKPIIDILLELPTCYDGIATVHLLEQSGWMVMQENAVSKTIDFNKGYTPHGFAKKVFHLHVKPLGDWGELYFRDYLRRHADTAGQYEELKQSLCMQFEYNRDAYTHAKTAFIMQNTQKARIEFGERYLPPFMRSMCANQPQKPLV